MIENQLDYEWKSTCFLPSRAGAGYNLFFLKFN